MISKKCLGSFVLNGKIKLSETILGHETIWLHSSWVLKFGLILAERQRGNRFEFLYVIFTRDLSLQGLYETVRYMVGKLSKNATIASDPIFYRVAVD